MILKGKTKIRSLILCVDVIMILLGAPLLKHVKGRLEKSAIFLVNRAFRPLHSVLAFSTGT